MSTVTAGQVAAELRKLADLFDAQPELKVDKPFLSFCSSEKASFVNAVRLLPRPLAKKQPKPYETYGRVKVEYTGDAIDIWASVPQSLTCELIEPAKPAVYRCDPILSLEEESEVGL